MFPFNCVERFGQGYSVAPRSFNLELHRFRHAVTPSNDEVEILRRGQEIVQREPKRNLGQTFAALGAMPDDFMAEDR